MSSLFFYGGSDGLDSGIKAVSESLSFTIFSSSSSVSAPNFYLP
jgi:hypothetical protein